MRAITLLLAVILLATGPTRTAEGKRPTPAELARQYFQEGKRLFLAEQYDHALSAFRQAHARRQLPDILFMIGQCQRNLGQIAEAILSYRGYLDGKPEARERKQVEALIGRLEALVPRTGEDDPPPPVEDPSPVPPTSQPRVALELGSGPTGPSAPTTTAAPLHKRWWFWAVVSGAVAAALGAGIAIGYSVNGAADPPSGSIGTVDLRLR